MLIVLLRIFRTMLSDNDDNELAFAFGFNRNSLQCFIFRIMLLVKDIKSYYVKIFSISNSFPKHKFGNYRMYFECC